MYAVVPKDTCVDANHADKQAQRYTCTQRQTQVCKHHLTLKCVDRHRQAQGNWQEDIYSHTHAGRLTGTKLNRQKAGCWKH